MLTRRALVLFIVGTTSSAGNIPLSEAPATLLFLIDAWNNGTGGIQTVNRNLCVALAAVTRAQDLPFKICCLAADCSDPDRDEAKMRGVILHKAVDVQVEDGDGRVITSMAHPALADLPPPACVVGHSKFTGIAARAVRDHQFKNARVITFYHMDPDSTEGLKEGQPPSQDRVMIERKVALQSDIAFAVGPFLLRQLEHLLFELPSPRPKIEMLLCGISDDVTPRDKLPPVRTFLFVGRVEHPHVKGVDLFARAAGRLIKRLKDPDVHELATVPKFVIRGFPNDPDAESRIYKSLYQQAKEEADDHEVIIARRYFTADEREIQKDIRHASVLVMPSRAEGFGLVALEAISAGVPAIIAADSGLAEVIIEKAQAGFRAEFIVNTRAKTDEAVGALTTAMQRFVLFPFRGPLVAKSQLELLRPICSWNQAAKVFLNKTMGVITNEQPLAVPSLTAEIERLLWAEEKFVNLECQRLTGKELIALYVNRQLSPVRPGSASQEAVSERPQSKSDSVPWSDALSQATPVIILGAPGIGKTVALLQETATRCAKGLNALASSKEITAAFYFHANLVAGFLVTSGTNLLHVAVGLISERHGPLSDAVQSWLQASFRNGRMSLLIDGLDEVASLPSDPADRRAALLTQVATLAKVSNGCPVILSSRVSGYPGAALPQSEEWQLVPFETPQIRKFIRGWLLEFPEAVEELRKSITRVPPLAEILSNPLLLMLACRIWERALRAAEPLPQFPTRCDLYEHFRANFQAGWVERLATRGNRPTLLLGEALADFILAFSWQLWRDDPRRADFSRRQIIAAIEAIPKTREMQQRPDLLSDLCDAGVLTKAAPYDPDAPYLFLHRTILEYLVASYLATHAADPVAVARTYFDNRHASVVLWMLAGTLDQPEPLFSALVEWAEGKLVELDHESTSIESPYLAELLTNCLFECGRGKLSNRWRQRAWDIVTRGLDRDQRRYRGQGGQWMGLANWSLCFRALASVETHEGQRARAHNILDIFQEIRNASSSANSEAGKRLRSAITLNQQVLMTGMQSVCPVVRWAAIWAGTAFFALGLTEVKEVLGPPIRAAMEQDKSPFVRSIATRSFGLIYSEEATPLLISVMDRRDPFVAAAAANALGNIASDIAVSALTNKAKTLLEDEAASAPIEGYYSEGALAGEPKDPRTTLLQSIIGGLDILITKYTARGPAPANPTLTAVLNLALAFRKAPVIRGTAASALGKLRWTPAWNDLKAMVLDRSGVEGDVQQMRASACYACDQIARDLDPSLFKDAAQFFGGLLSELHETPHVRRPAASGAAKLLRGGYCPSQLYSDMMEAAGDHDALVARNALYGLLHLSLEVVLPDLILLVATLSVFQRKQLFLVAVDVPGAISLSIVAHLIINDGRPSVLESGLHAVTQLLRRTRYASDKAVDALLSDELFFAALARRLAELLDQEESKVLPQGLGAFASLYSSCAAQAKGGLAAYADTIAAKSRTFLRSANPTLVQNACYALGDLGTAADLPLLAELGKAREANTRKAAASAHDYLKRRVVPTRRPGIV